VARSRNHCCYVSPTKPSLRIVVDPPVAFNNIQPLGVGNARRRPLLHYCRAYKYFELLWKIQTYLGFGVKRPIFLSHFNQICIFSTYFRDESPQCQISRKSLKWERRCYMQTGRQADIETEAIRRFSLFIRTRLKIILLRMYVCTVSSVWCLVNFNVRMVQACSFCEIWCFDSVVCWRFKSSEMLLLVDLLIAADVSKAFWSF
jgi:hypothetical protein